MGSEAPRNEELGEAQRIAVLYAPQPLRACYHSFLLLDAQLARIALTAREPALAQLKLSWWRDACIDLSKRRGSPLLLELAQAWGGDGSALVGLIDGWEEVAVGEGGFAAAAERLGEARAVACAAAAGVPVDEACRVAARCWTLVTLAAAAPDDWQRTAMLDTARALPATQLPRALRPLALLDGLARRALTRGGGPLLGDRLSPLAALRLGIFGR